MNRRSVFKNLAALVIGGPSIAKAVDEPTIVINPPRMTKQEILKLYYQNGTLYYITRDELKAREKMRQDFEAAVFWGKMPEE